VALHGQRECITQTGTRIDVYGGREWRQNGTVLDRIARRFGQYAWSTWNPYGATEVALVDHERGKLPLAVVDSAIGSRPMTNIIERRRHWDLPAFGAPLQTGSWLRVVSHEEGISAMSCHVVRHT